MGQDLKNQVKGWYIPSQSLDPLSVSLSPQLLQKIWAWDIKKWLGLDFYPSPQAKMLNLELSSLIDKIVRKGFNDQNCLGWQKSRIGSDEKELND